jgi:hypothetical protein
MDAHTSASRAAGDTAALPAALALHVNADALFTVTTLSGTSPAPKADADLPPGSRVVELRVRGNRAAVLVRPFAQTLLTMARACRARVTLFSTAMPADVLDPALQVLGWDRYPRTVTGGEGRTLAALLGGGNVRPGLFQSTLIVDTCVAGWAPRVRDIVLTVPGHIPGANWWSATTGSDADAAQATHDASPWPRGHHLGLLHTAVALNRAASLYYEGMAQTHLHSTSSIIAFMRRTVFTGASVYLPATMPTREYLEEVVVGGGGTIARSVATATHVVYHPSAEAIAVASALTKRSSSSKRRSSSRSSSDNDNVAKASPGTSASSSPSSLNGGADGGSSEASAAADTALLQVCYDPDAAGTVAGTDEPEYSSDSAFVLATWVERSADHLAQLPPVFFTPQSGCMPSTPPFAGAVLGWHPAPRTPEHLQKLPQVPASAVPGLEDKAAPSAVRPFDFVAGWLFLQLVAPQCCVVHWPGIAEAAARIPEVLKLPEPSACAMQLMLGVGAPAMVPRRPHVEGSTATGFLLSADERCFALISPDLDITPSQAVATITALRAVTADGKLPPVRVVSSCDAQASMAPRKSTANFECQASLSTLPEQRVVAVGCTLDLEQEAREEAQRAAQQQQQLYQHQQLYQQQQQQQLQLQLSGYGPPPANPSGVGSAGTSSYRAPPPPPPPLHGQGPPPPPERLLIVATSENCPDIQSAMTEIGRRFPSSNPLEDIHGRGFTAAFSGSSRQRLIGDGSVSIGGRTYQVLPMNAGVGMPVQPLRVAVGVGVLPGPTSRNTSPPPHGAMPPPPPVAAPQMTPAAIGARQTATTTPPPTKVGRSEGTAAAADGSGSGGGGEDAAASAPASAAAAGDSTPPEPMTPADLEAAKSRLFLKARLPKSAGDAAILRAAKRIENEGNHQEAQQLRSYLSTASAAA